MKRNKKTIFTKSIYAAFALLVLLVAAGIASYAVAPPGAATHATLYTDDIYSKSGSVITAKNTLRVENNVDVASSVGGVPAVSVTNLAGDIGIDARSSDIAVIGSNSGRTGKLGTTNAGVEGTGNYGVNGRGTTYGVYGDYSSQAGNVYGALGDSRAGIYGRSNVAGYNGVQGEVSDATNPNGYAGRFDGGKGLYASKISFGGGAFDTSALGSLILGANAGTACNTVCPSHGLAAGSAFTTAGTGVSILSTTGQRYCWCD